MTPEDRARQVAQQWNVSNMVERHIVDAIRAAVEEVAVPARNYLAVATYPDWSSGDCRVCDMSDSHTHTPSCPYERAEMALRKTVGLQASEGMASLLVTEMDSAMVLAIKTAGKGEGLQLTNGNRWLVWTGSLDHGRWEVFERRRGTQITTTLYQGRDEIEAVRELVRE